MSTRKIAPKYNQKNDSPYYSTGERLPDCLWSCPECGSRNLANRYKGATMICFDCARWADMTQNSSYEHRGQKKLTPTFTKEEFLEWSNRDPSPKHCFYCNVPEKEIYNICMKNDGGRKTQKLGLDRVDSSKGYALDNIVFCCLACNRQKGDIFTAEEFKQYIAPSIKQVWYKRLGYI